MIKPVTNNKSDWGAVI